MRLPALTRAISGACLLAACLASAPCLAGEPAGNPKASPIPEEVEAYARELKIVSADPNAGAGVEGLLKLGQNASAALVLPARPGEETVLERLSDEELQVVVHKMQGFMVNREEIVYVEPDPAFFLALAKRAHDPASVEFFEAYRKTKPNVWPVYIDQQTDYSGCIRFGTLSLVDTYKAWDAYGRKYPTRYAQEAGQFLRDVEETLTGGVCACDDKEGALREFTAFIRAFPRAKITPRLRARVDQLHQGKSDIRAQCVSG